MYIRNRRHLRKYEPRDEVGPAVDSPEVTEEMPITTDKEESISPENHQGEGASHTQTMETKKHYQHMAMGNIEPAAGVFL